MLVAALTTAIYFLIGERYTHELGSTRFAAIGMSASAVMLALHFAVFRSFDELARACRPTTGCCSCPGRSRACSSRASCRRKACARVGAQRAAIGSTIGPPTTIVLAALFLGERLNVWQLLGSAMIVGSVLS